MRSFTMSIDRGFQGGPMNKALSTQNLDRFRSMDDLGLKEKNSGVELVKLLRVCLDVNQFSSITYFRSRRQRSQDSPRRMFRWPSTTAVR